MTDFKDLALERLNQARDVYDALSSPFTTPARIDKAIASIERTRSTGSEMLLHLRGQRKALSTPTREDRGSVSVSA